MLSTIISDNPTTAARLRQIVIDHGGNCPLSHVVSVENALDAVTSLEQKPDLVFVVFSADADRALPWRCWSS
ncbi:MAG: hypothetical protein IH899_02600 [Planctomycetes bacterium]|nr:hypothetical protein [Planctomycetota bacterium]